MVIGVVRVSTKNQHTDRQEYNILKIYPNAKIIKIIYSGAKVIGQKDFDKTMKQLQKGDLLVFDAVTRMSRNTNKGVALYEDLFKRGVDIEFLKDPLINTSVYRQTMDNQIQLQSQTGDEATDTFVNSMIKIINDYNLALARKQVIEAFKQAQKELENIQQNTKDGMDLAKRNGKRIGTPKGTILTTKKSIEIKKVMLKHCEDFGGTLNDIECMNLTGVARNTFYKYKKELWAEYGENEY